MWEELIPRLPTRMSEFHEWYMKASATKDVVFHARVQVGLKTVGNGRENPLTVHVSFFFAGNGNGKYGRENEIDITGYREWNILVGNISITIGKISLRSGTPIHVTTSNI